MATQVNFSELKQNVSMEDHCLKEKLLCQICIYAAEHPHFTIDSSMLVATNTTVDENK